MPSFGRASGFPLGNSSTRPKRIEPLRPSCMGSGQKHRINNSKRQLMNDSAGVVVEGAILEGLRRGKSSRIQSFGFRQRETGGASLSLVSARAGISATKRRCASIGRSGRSLSQVRRCWTSMLGFAATGRPVFPHQIHVAFFCHREARGFADSSRTSNLMLALCDQGS